MNTPTAERTHSWPVLTSRLVFIVASLALPSGLLRATPGDVSNVVGVHRVRLAAGPNFLSAPLHRAATFRGTLQSVAADVLTFSGSPGWTANQFGPRDGNRQYVALLRNDVSATPGNIGDWWFITANTANTLTLSTDSEDLTTVVGVGDEIEIRRLTSLKDLFGAGSTLLLNMDANGSANPNDEDVIYLVAQTSFSSEIYYHNGALAPAGYYVDGNGPFDGSTITMGLDQPIMIFRKNGSTLLNFLTAGSVQSTPLTHYLSGGANPVGTGFPVDSTIGSSGLLEAGWMADSNGSPSTAEEDVLYTVAGSSFADEIFLHDGSVASPGWYVNGTSDDAFPLVSSRGLVLFVKSPAGLHWRQPRPF